MLFFYSCNKEPQVIDLTVGFPQEIQEIFATKCATAGCHNDKSFQNAAGLNLSSWDKLIYDGGTSGSVVIAGRPEFSSLFQFINSYEDLGLTAVPQMPLNQPNLSREEVMTIKKWITDSCKSLEGDVPFAKGFEVRKKVLIANQGCDVLAVIDAESKLIMRYIDLGKRQEIESPHFLSMSADGQFFYTCYINGDVVHKFSAKTGQLLGEAYITPGLWNVVRVTPDGKTVYVSDLQSNGRIANVNTETMTLRAMYGQGLFISPHGIETSEGAGDTLYITAQNGNSFYKFIPKAFQNTTISLVKGQAPNFQVGTYDPHEVTWSPDRSKYFFSCQASDEVRVFDAKTDTLLKVIPVGEYPLEFAISKNKKLLFVSCTEQPNPTNALLRGSVDVIDLNTLTVVKTLYGKFFQPHGMAVDETRNELWVASRNATADGPPPHHVSACGSRNGYFEVFDINTWQRVTSARELSVDPYAVTITP